MGIGSILTRDRGDDVEICKMGVVDFNVRSMGSEGHGFDFKENGELMAAVAVAVVAAMVSACLIRWLG